MNSNPLGKNESDSAKSGLYSPNALLSARSIFIALLAAASFMGCTVRLKGLSSSSSETTSSAPVVSISSPSSTTVIETSGTVTFTVTTTGSTSVNLTSAKVTLNTTGGATCTKSVTNGTTTSATVTLSNCSGVGGTVSISIAAGIASNADGDLSSAAGPSSTVTVVTSAFTQTWPFNALSEASYSFDSSKINFTGGVCRLTGSDQIDSDNTASGFGGGTLNGAAWDATNGYVRLGNSGGCDGTSNACANQTASSLYELNSTWTPQWANLVAYWKMNNSWTDSRSTKNLTGNNGVTFSTSAKLGSHAGVFDGVDDEARRANPGISYVNDSFTLAGWFKASAASGTTRLGMFSTWHWDAAWTLKSYTEVFIHTDHTLRFAGQDSLGVYKQTASTATYRDDVWHHFVAVRDKASSLLLLYVDGGLVASTADARTGSFDMAVDNNSIVLGRDSASSFNGSLDDFAHWNVALSAIEVQTLYSRQATKYSGTLTSRVMDAFQTGMSWTTFSWITTLPFMKELTDYASGALQNESSTDYSALVGSNGSTSDNDLMSSLAALYHMNGSGSLANGSSILDESGNNRTGTIYNGNGTGLTYSPGKLGTALYFDGVDDEIDIASGLNPWGGDFSFSLWAYPTSKSAAQHNALATGSAGTNGFRFGIASSDRWRYWTTESGGTIVIGDATVSPPVLNTWQHLAITYKSSTSTTKMYVNGVEVASSTGTFVAPGAGGSIGKYGGYMFAGYLDELAIWGRTLHTTEVQQLYRRGANRIKHQVRICTASDCSDDSTGANWKGPDGTNQTYFSELNNNSAALAMTGDVKKTLPSMLFSDFTSPVGTSRYFQYRTILESDDTGTSCNYGSGAASCSPELKSVTVDPTHYDSSSPTIIGKTGVSYSSLATFTQTLGSSCASGIGYNLGVGAAYSSATWYWWDSAANAGAGGWVAADGTVAKSNSAASINTNAATFGTQVGTGTVYFKAFLKSTGTTACELDKLDLTGQQ